MIWAEFFLVVVIRDSRSDGKGLTVPDQILGKNGQTTNWKYRRHHTQLIDARSLKIGRLVAGGRDCARPNSDRIPSRIETVWIPGL